MAARGRQPGLKECFQGSWAANQRTAYRQGRLRAELVAELEAVDLWKWNPQQAAWDSRLAILKVSPTHSDCCMQPAGGHTGSDAWLPELFPPNPHFTWLWNLIRPIQIALQAFMAVHGRMPRVREELEGSKVGQWVSNQRQAYRKGTLRARRVAALEALPGWTWTHAA